MNGLVKQVTRTILTVPKYSYTPPPRHSETHHYPGLTAKRIINCVHKRLNAIDPDRWNGVPITFNTHWRDEGGFADIQTSIQVHEALQKQFGIEIKDRQTLVTDIETAFYIVNQHHDAY